MAGFNEASCFVKVGLSLFLLGTVLYIIGFSTDAWKSYTAKTPFSATSKKYYVADYDIGLWEYLICRIGWDCNNVKYHDNHQGYDKLLAAQAFACLGLICFLVNVILTFVFIWVEKAHTRAVILADAVLAVLGVVFAVICCAIYSSFWWGSVGWSQGLFIAGFLINFFAFVVLILDYLGKKVG